MGVGRLGGGVGGPAMTQKRILEDGMGDQSEFVELCSKAGHQACEQGQYREAIRLLHLGCLGWVEQ